MKLLKYWRNMLSVACSCKTTCSLFWAICNTCRCIWRSIMPSRSAFKMEYDCCIDDLCKRLCPFYFCFCDVVVSFSKNMTQLSKLSLFYYSDRSFCPVLTYIGLYLLFSWASRFYIFSLGIWCGNVTTFDCLFVLPSNILHHTARLIGCYFGIVWFLSFQ